MSQRNKKKSASEDMKCIPLTQPLRQQMQAFNTLIMGARMALGVPDEWTINREQTAFVPPQELPVKE